MAISILTSHPIQYYAPLFREIASRIDTKVFYAHRATPEQQAADGFDTSFDWDIDLFGGYAYEFLNNVAHIPTIHNFAGCDTPEIYGKLAGKGTSALVVTGWHLKSYWQGIWAAKRYGIPVIVRGDSHLDTPRSTAKRLAKELVYPAFLRLFDSALYVGQRNRAYYQHYRYPSGRLFYAPHSVDTDRFAAATTLEARVAMRSQLNIAADEKAVLFAGKVQAIKRPLDVISAVALVRANGILAHVVIAGSGPLEAAAKAHADSLRVPLHMLGFRNQTEMPAAYAAADVMVLPSESETWGLVCNEALACGTPIVVSDTVGCAPDLANDGLAGRTFPLGNIPAMANAIAYILTAPPSAKAIREVSERHSLGAAATGLIAALNHLSVNQ